MSASGGAGVNGLAMLDDKPGNTESKLEKLELISYNHKTNTSLIKCGKASELAARINSQLKQLGVERDSGRGFASVKGDRLELQFSKFDALTIFEHCESVFEQYCSRSDFANLRQRLTTEIAKTKIRLTSVPPSAGGRDNKGDSKTLAPQPKRAVEMPKFASDFPGFSTSGAGSAGHAAGEVLGSKLSHFRTIIDNMDVVGALEFRNNFGKELLNGTLDISKFDEQILMNLITRGMIKGIQTPQYRS